MGNARSRLTGPRTERAVVSRMTPAMSASSGQGTDQGTPKVRVTRLEYKAQQHTPGGVGDRFGRHHAGQLAAAHADGAQRAVLAGAGGYPQADSIHDMEHRDRHDHREEPVNQHREGIIQPRCLSIPLYFIMLHLYLDGEVNLPLQLSGLDRPKRNKF